MPYSLYEATVPQLQATLTALTNILDKTTAHQTTASADPESILAWKLADDMLPLSFQVYMVTDLAAKFVARLKGEEPAAWKPEDIASLAAAKARVGEVEALLKDASKEFVDGKAESVVPMGLGPGRTEHVSAAAYANGYTMPNAFFHLSMAYAVVRSKGVQVGKLDYIKPYLAPYIKF